MLTTIKGLHDGLKAKVFAEGALSDPFEVTTGVRQGCCLAPILFSLFFAIVIKDWKQHIMTRVKLRTRLDGNLHRCYTGGAAIQEKDSLEEVAVLDAEFADDLMVFAENILDLHILVKSLHEKIGDREQK